MEEGDFPRSPEAERERIRDTWSIDKLGAKLEERITEWGEWLKAHMTQWTDSGPKDYVVDDDSAWRGNSNQNTNVNSFSLPRGARELIVAIVMALSIMVNVVLGGMYIGSQRTVADAYKDLQTQVWVKQDKEEEKFQKFVAGPYADLAGEVKASQILFSKCKESRP